MVTELTTSSEFAGWSDWAGESRGGKNENWENDGLGEHTCKFLERRLVEMF